MRPISHGHFIPMFAVHKMALSMWDPISVCPFTGALVSRYLHCENRSCYYIWPLSVHSIVNQFSEYVLFSCIAICANRDAL